MKLTKKEILFLTIGLPICWISIVLYLTGVIVFDYCGFAVDDNGRLYVGENRKINVYDNGEFIQTIQDVSRGYNFTIQGEELRIATNERVKVLDLSGNLIKILDDRGWPNEQDRLYKQKDIFETGHARYVATNIFGLYRITKYDEGGNGEIVYHISAIDYILRAVVWIYALCIFIILATGYRKRKQREKKKRQRRN